MSRAGWPKRSVRQPSHRQLFLAREYEAIKGRHSVVFWSLYVIVLVSLAAVVIGRAGLDHLQAKMEDPFTSWVNISVSNTKHSDDYADIKAYLDTCADQKRFQAASSSGNYITGWGVYAEDVEDKLYARVQSFGFWTDSTLLRAVVSPGNLITDLSGGDLTVAKNYSDGVIITRALLEEMGCDTGDLRQKRILVFEGAYIFPLRVLAVVETLPGKSKVFCEHALALGIKDTDAHNVVESTTTNELVVYLDAEDVPRDELASRLGPFLQVLTRTSTLPQIEPCSTLVSHAVLARMPLDQPMDQETLLFIQSRLTENDALARMGPSVLFPLSFKEPTPELGYGDGGLDKRSPMFDQLSVIFSDLDSIGAFQRDIQHRYEVELDLDRVESKKNFATISRLSEFLILTLVLFALLAILLFLYNLLKNHLERIKMNLGTFMAFGLSEGFLLTGYLRIILTLVVRVIVWALVTLLLFQVLLVALEQMGARLPALFQYFDVITNLWLYGSLVALLVAAFIIFRWQLRQFLSAPPGDLIYARA